MAVPKIYGDFQQSVQRLKEALVWEKSEMARDSSIKRFELCFDLAGKAVKTAAEASGLSCYSPRECFKTAYRLKLIDNEPQWLKLIDDRNRTAHLYSLDMAEEVYERLPDHLSLLSALAQKLAAEA